MKSLLKLILISAFLLISACSLWPKTHRLDTHQGNVINQGQIQQLKTGMSKSQVQYVLGTPLLKDFLHADRWDYVYYFKPGYGETKQYHLVLDFQNDKLAKIQQLQQFPEKLID